MPLSKLLPTRLIASLMLVATGYLAGCGEDPIRKALNEKFPPVSAEQQRQEAIKTAAEALTRLAHPNVLLAVNLSDAGAALLSPDLKKAGVERVVLSGDTQLLRAVVGYSHKFTEADAGDNAQAKAWLAEARPEIAGEIEVYSGITSAVTGDAAAPQLELKLLPGLSRIVIHKITLAERIDVTADGDIVAGLLNRYKDNVSGELSRSKFTRLALPALAEEPIDLAKGLKVSSPGDAISINVDAKPIVVPVKLGGVAWLIDEQVLTALVQLDDVAAAAPPVPDAAKSVEPNFPAIQGAALGHVRDSFGLTETDKTTRAAIRKDLLAFTLNSTIKQASACVTATGEQPQNFESKIPLPDGAGIDCSSNRDCESNRTCSFKASRDDRDCMQCLLHAFGKCVGKGDNPLCVAARKAQQLIYDADANLKKADCDRLRAMETAGCQAEEAGKKTICEAGKVALIALKKTGNFGNLDVDAKVATNDAKICLQDFNLAPGMDRLALALDVTGKVGADVHIKFTPLDIVGHLTCQLPWTETQHFDAAVSERAIADSSSVAFVDKEGKPHLRFSVDETTVKATLKPGPAEFLAQSPNMIISCPAAGGIAALSVGLAPFVKELRGDFDIKVKKKDFDLELPEQRVMLGEKEAKGRFSDTPLAVALTIR